MGTRICAHCGEPFEEGKLVCPHCGADADYTWAETPSEFEFDAPTGPSDRDYERFLEREGLTAPKARKRGLCVLAVLLVPGAALWLVLL